MNGKAWLTVLSVVAPVVSAVIVAYISHQASLQIAQLESLAAAASNDVELAKVLELQNARREAFIAMHVPKLFSADAAERGAGQVLLAVTYPLQAKEIFAAASAVKGDDPAQSLKTADNIVRTVQRGTGEWSIVISGDRDLNPVKDWIEGSKKLKYSPIFVYERQKFYRVVVGSYPTRDAAEQALVVVRRSTRPDAYVVARQRWCTETGIRTEDKIQIIQCVE